MSDEYLQRLAEWLARAPRDPAALGYVSPGGSMPFPAPDTKFRPVACWQKGPDRIQFEPATGRQDTPILRATWGITSLDMRPDTASGDSLSGDAWPVNRTVGAQLFVLVSGLQASSHFGMEAFVRLYGHPFDVSQSRQIQQDTNVTAELSVGLDAVVLNALPFSGYPMRFWKWELVLEFGTTRPAVLPQLAAAGGLY